MSIGLEIQQRIFTQLQVLEVIFSVFQEMNPILFTLLITAALTDCPLDPYPRRTLVDHISANLDNNPSLHNKPQDFSYTLPNALSSSGMTVATAILALELNSHEAIFFSIENLPTTQTTLLKFRVTANDGSWGWRSLRFNFFGTSQENLFQVRSQSVSQFSIGLEEGNYAVYTVLPNAGLYSAQPIVRVFISGVNLLAVPLGQDREYQKILTQYQSFRTFSTNQVLIKYFEEAVEDKKSLQFKISHEKIINNFLSFSIKTNTELRSLRFSYILFSNVTILAQHQYVMGTVTLVKDYEPQISILSSMKMLFTGLTNFHIPRDKNYKFSISFKNALEQGSFSASTNINYLEASFNYFAIRLQQLYVCIDCPNNSTIIYDNQHCVGMCPRGFSITERLGNRYCDKCEIQKLKIVDPDTGLCVCAQRHYWNATQDTCLPCPYDCYTCDRGDRCLTCDTMPFITRRTMNGNLRCKCPAVGFYDDAAAENIVCKACSRMCLTCSGPRDHDCLTCANGKEVNSQGFCVCSKQYIQISPGICACPEPYVIMSGFCVNPFQTCEDNEIQQFVDVTQKCVCAVGAYQVLNKCIKCPLRSVFNEKQLRCQCTNQTVEVGGQCVPCGTNQVYDEVSKRCTCALGTFKTDNGLCVTCPPRMAYSNGKCQCIYNYFELSAGVCRRCQKDTDGPKCRSTTVIL